MTFSCIVKDAEDKKLKTFQKVSKMFIGVNIKLADVYMP